MHQKHNKKIYNTVKFVEIAQKDHECSFCKKKIEKGFSYFTFARLVINSNFSRFPEIGYPKKCCYYCYPNKHKPFKEGKYV